MSRAKALIADKHGTPAKLLRRGPRDVRGPSKGRRASLRASAMGCPTKSLALPVPTVRAKALIAGKDACAPTLGDNTCNQTLQIIGFRNIQQYRMIARLSSLLYELQAPARVDGSFRNNIKKHPL
jgi:hypothetical protein